MLLGGGSLPDLPTSPVPVPQILRDTGVFEHTWKELELWLEHLDNTKEENRETVIQFLERVSTPSGAGEPVPTYAARR